MTVALTLRRSFAMLVLCLLPAAASAKTLELDFGSVSKQRFGDDPVSGGTLEMRFFDVASGMNASVIASRPFAVSRPSYQGSVDRDVRVNMTAGQEVDLTLRLWDAAAGNGFQTLYAPGLSYQWSLGFYDLDGRSNYHDQIDLTSSGYYTRTATSAVLVSEPSPGVVSFSGAGANGNVPGQSGLADEITKAQADVAVAVTMVNEPEVSFTYRVVGGEHRGRNLLVDGGQIFQQLLLFDLVTAPTPATPASYPSLTADAAPVPLPLSMALLLGSFGLLFMTQWQLRRRLV